MKTLSSWVLGITLSLGMAQSHAHIDELTNYKPTSAVKMIESASLEVDYRSLMNTLKNNQTKWYHKRLKNYSFTLKRSCRCTAEFRKPVNIEVERSRVVSAKTNNGKNAWNRAQTIDDIFATIRDAIISKAAVIRVKYHRTYGFPVSVYIDQNSRMADEEYTLTVSKLRFVQVSQAPSGQMCGNNRPQMCTKEYRPVCGVTKQGQRKSYSNSCMACSNKHVKTYTYGNCQ